MTRINTNVSSLNAQKSLAQSNAQLQEALTRLSTGLRINSGKDDPAGLIASEMLRSDIVSTNKAISNSQRANQMIATADSALGQVSSLLNDIRGLVGEAANKGALSDDQIAANQLQIDSSLEAIDRISQSTQFQGRRLLDGNLSFVTEGVSNTSVTDLAINKANFGTLSQIDVKLDVAAQATQAELDYASNTVTDPNGVVLELGGAKGFQAFNFAYNTSVTDLANAVNLVSDALGVSAEVQQVLATAAAAGSMTASSVGANNDITLTAQNAGRANGDIAVKYVKAAAGGARAIGYTANATSTDQLSVTLATGAWQAANQTYACGGTIRLVSKIKGTEYDNINVTIDSNTAAVAGAYYDSDTKTVHLQLVDGANGSTEAAAAVAANPFLNALFTATVVGGNAGMNTGAATRTSVTAALDGGGVAASETAVSIGGTGGSINSCADANGYVLSAATGTGVTTAFEEYAIYGTANIGRSTDTNDRLQFLGPADSRDLPIRFVTDGASQSLSITADPLYGSTGKSTAVFQDANVGSSFKVEAKQTGTSWDGFRIQVVTSGATASDYVTWDAESKVITVGVNLGTADGTADKVISLINSDPFTSKYFTASTLGANGAGQITSPTTTYSRYSTGGQAYSGVTVHLATDTNGVATTTAAQLVSFVEGGPNALTDLGISVTNAQGSNGAGRLAASTIQWHTVGETMTSDFAQGVTYAANGGNAALRIKARTAGAAYQDVRVVFEDTGSISFGYNTTTKTLTIGIDEGTTKASDLVAAYTANSAGSSAVYPLFDIQATGANASHATTSLLSASDGVRLGAGNTADGAVMGVRNTGNTYGAYLLGNVDVGDAIGANGVKFKAVDYGLDAFVSVKALSGTFNVTDTAGGTKDRAYGTDINARINGIQAIGKGLQASINTATLDMAVTVSSNPSIVTTGTSINFTIKSGGAQFQIGPEVVSNQQTRLGLTSMSTATLGTSAGRLYQLRSGGSASLKTNVNLAASIADGVINEVTTFRGRLGAFQRTTLDTNIKALTDTVEALTDAQSSIRDADFAAETAAMTRAQILVQSGLSVLSIANSRPQNVLTLLRG